MQETDSLEEIALIGRRSVPPTHLPPSGRYWNGPVGYDIRSENGSGFRWDMVSADQNHYPLARSFDCFPRAEACEADVRRFAPTASIQHVG